MRCAAVSSVIFRAMHDVVEEGATAMPATAYGTFS